MKTTHVALILDKSGSMGGIAEAAVNHYNDQIRSFKKIAAEEGGDVKVSLVTFSTDVYEHLWDVTAADLQECRQGDYVADGWTSLLDAIGYAVDKLRETTDYQNPDNVYLVVIITDGQENHSSHYNNGVVNEMIDSLQKTNRWTFTFMGCDRHYITEIAQQLNVPLANCALWDNSSMKRATKGYVHTSACVANMVRGLSSGESESFQMAYNSADPAAMADFASVDDAKDASLDWAAAATPSASCCASDQGAAIFSTGSRVDSWKQ